MGLRGTKVEQMKMLLEFIYSGEVKVLQEELDEFIKLANSLKIIGLVQETIDENLDKSLKDKEFTLDQYFDIDQDITTKFERKMIAVEPEEKEKKSIFNIHKTTVIGNDSSYKDNNSLEEYDQRVIELTRKSTYGWECTECPYSDKIRGHVLEHVEKHVEGFSIQCNFCEKAFSRRRTMRFHLRKCRQFILNSTR